MNSIKVWKVVNLDDLTVKDYNSLKNWSIEIKHDMQMKSYLINGQTIKLPGQQCLIMTTNNEHYETLLTLAYGQHVILIEEKCTNWYD
jgi:hypothetical protein